MKNPAKVLLRKKIGELLKSTSEESRCIQSKIISEKLFRMPEFRNSRRVSIYLNTDYEVNTIEIMKKLFFEGKEVFIPTCSGSDMTMLKLYDYNDYEKLPLSKWSIKQPSADEVHRENPMLTDALDLIILPGVAFSRRGGRLGHGMGFYDKYLHKYFNRFPDRRKINKTFLVALAFQEQIVDDDQLPLDPHDFPLDLVLTTQS